MGRERYRRDDTCQGKQHALPASLGHIRVQLVPRLNPKRLSDAFERDIEKRGRGKLEDGGRERKGRDMGVVMPGRGNNMHFLHRRDIFELNRCGANHPRSLSFPCSLHPPFKFSHPLILNLSLKRVMESECEGQMMICVTTP